MSDNRFLGYWSANQTIIFFVFEGNLSVKVLENNFIEAGVQSTPASLVCEREFYGITNIFLVMA